MLTVRLVRFGFCWALCAFKNYTLLHLLIVVDCTIIQSHATAINSLPRNVY